LSGSGMAGKGGAKYGSKLVVKGAVKKGMAKGMITSSDPALTGKAAAGAAGVMSAGGGGLTLGGVLLAALKWAATAAGICALLLLVMLVAAVGTKYARKRLRRMGVAMESGALSIRGGQSGGTGSLRDRLGGRGEVAFDSNGRINIDFGDGDQGSAPREDAKRRLQVVLIQDRWSLPAEAMDDIKSKVLSVMEDYVEVDEHEEVRTSVCQDPQRGTIFQVTLPVRRVKEEDREVTLQLEQFKSRRSRELPPIRPGQRVAKAAGQEAEAKDLPPPPAAEGGGGKGYFDR